jgi:ABC-type glycerol-3-phosphate transport system substrate-binding protein
MRCILIVVAALMLLSATSTAEAGAKGGKIRWSSNSNIPNGKPPIKVPAADESKPGIVELKIVFVANKLAEFVLVGDGDTDIDVYVFDAQGNEVAKDEDPATYGSDLCVCRWTPTEEQEYKIRIVNRGKVYNVCQAGTN